MWDASSGVEDQHKSQTHTLEFDLIFDRVSGKTGLQRCLQYSICWNYCSFSWKGCEWQRSHLNTPGTQTVVDENKCITTAGHTHWPGWDLTAGTWEAGPCAGCFFLLRRVIHNPLWFSDPGCALLTTSVLPQKGDIQTRTYTLCPQLLYSGNAFVLLPGNHCNSEVSTWIPHLSLLSLQTLFRRKH